MLSIAAQIYDPAGSILGFPIFLFKHIFRDLTHNHPNMDWDAQIPSKHQDWVRSALEVFYVAREYKLPRYNITYHPDAQYHLVCMCDAGEYYYSHVILLITQFSKKEENNFVSKCTPLNIKKLDGTKRFLNTRN